MDQKNFIVAIVLSVVIIMGWQTLFPAKHTPPQQQASQTAGAERAPAGNPVRQRRPARRRPAPARAGRRS